MGAVSRALSPSAVPLNPVATWSSFAKARVRCLLSPRSTTNTISSSQAVRHSHPHYPSPSPDRDDARVLGGTAGCVVAGRLATADPDLRILVLEAGPTTHNDPAHMHPALFLSHIMPGSQTVRGHESRPSAALGGRTTIVQTGPCLGGGGSVNCAFLFPPPLSPFSDLFGSGNKEG